MRLCSYCNGEAVLSYYDDDFGTVIDDPCPRCKGFAWTKRRILDLLDPKKIPDPYKGPSVESVIQREINLQIAAKERYAARLAARKENK